MGQAVNAPVFEVLNMYMYAEPSVATGLYAPACLYLLFSEKSKSQNLMQAMFYRKATISRVIWFLGSLSRTQQYIY